MSERQQIPQGLAELPPGPALSGILAGLDLTRLNGHDLVHYLTAQARQLAHEQARLLAAIAEIMHCPPGGPDAPVQRGEVTEFAAEEIRFALHWTGRTVDRYVTLATDLTQRLPAVHTAMLAGHLDQARAEVISQETVICNNDTLARHLADTVLPVAATATTGQLRNRIRRLVLTEDPQAAAAREARARTNRRLVRRLDDDNTATLTGTGLPADRAAHAFARVNAIAWAAKRHGDDRSIDQLRADTLLDLLTGAGPAADSPLRGQVEITVNLDTLLGHTDNPGHLHGWGPILADTTRQLTHALHHGTWRVSVHDRNTAELLHHGITRRRPTADVDAYVKARDKTCRAPGCPIAAAHTDLDHTHDWTDNGPTIPANLGALCRGHHRYKHQGGAHLEQTRPGHFRWTTPLGHIYLVEPDHDTGYAGRAL